MTFLPAIAHHVELLALTAALLGAVPLLRPRLVDDVFWQRSLTVIVAALLPLIVFVFMVLVYAFATGDFSLAVVYLNSHSYMPTFYKFTAAWGNHEGSLLLWLVILSLCGVLCGRGLSGVTQARVMAILCGVIAVFLALSVFTSDPFLHLLPVHTDGQDLNPLLQDPGLAFHPPLLYAGYVGYALVYAIALAALWQGNLTPELMRALRRWSLVAWSFLTAGLALGAWWAYYELGWGGWWFWDPVENAALIPWLVGAALLHSVRVTQTSGSLPRWTLFLALLAFALSVLGTFLVRSGVLTSVHTFASDPLRGIALLVVFAVLVGGAFSLLALRWDAFPKVTTPPLGRAGMLLLNNVFLAAGAATVLTGTLYPLLIDALGREAITVGAPYFNATFVPLLLPLLLIMAVGQALPWSGTAQLRRTAMPIAGVMLLVALAYLYAIGMRNIMALAAFALGAAVVVGTAVDRTRHWGQLLAHVGLGIAVMGMAGTSLGIERITMAQPKKTLHFAGYDISVDSIDMQSGGNYYGAQMTLQVYQGRDYVTVLRPERRYFIVSEQWTTEAAIHTTLLGDLFVAMGELTKDGEVPLHFRWNPLQVWIWIGALLMLAGGLMATRRKGL